MINTISVIIPTFNRKQCLKTVLNCLAKQVKGDYKLKIIVVVDGSSDGTIELLNSEFPEIEVILGNGQWWYTRCINEGIKRGLQLEADYILTLNDDVVFDENYISTLLKAAANSVKEAIVGSVSYTMSSPHRITFSGIKEVIRWRLKEINYVRKFSIVDPNSLTGVKPSVNLSGRGMLIDSNIFKDIGMFDENLVQYGSDTDFSYRTFKKGYNVMISFDGRIFENEKLTSVGATYNKPSVLEYYKAFFNKHSSVSIYKSLYFYKKHGYIILLPLYTFLIFLGSIYSLKFKYNER